MMNIFDSGFKKKQQPPEPPIYGSCLSDLSMVNNKEGGNETKMKRLKAFVRRHIHQAKAKKRKLKVKEALKNSIKAVQWGLRGKEGKKCSDVSLGGVRNQRLSVFSVCVFLAGWLSVTAVCWAIIRGCYFQMSSRGSSGAGGDREEMRMGAGARCRRGCRGNNKKL